MLRPEKGHEFMLRVLHQLKREGKSFRWLVVGAGREEYEARLRQQTEYPNERRCVNGRIPFSGVTGLPDCQCGGHAFGK